MPIPWWIVPALLVLAAAGTGVALWDLSRPVRAWLTGGQYVYSLPSERGRRQHRAGGGTRAVQA